MNDAVTYTRADMVGTITMDDGKVNAFSIPVLQALHEALDRAEHDDCVVVLQGRPGCFSAGFDLPTLGGPRKMPSPSSGWERPWPGASLPSRHRSSSPALGTRSPQARSS